MIFLEEIINKIIELDNNAKRKIIEVKNKEDNIENYINERLIKEKEKADSQYAFKKKKFQEKYDFMYEQKIGLLEEKKEKKISELQEKYKLNQKATIENLLKNIIQ